MIIGAILSWLFLGYISGLMVVYVFDRLYGMEKDLRVYYTVALTMLGPLSTVLLSLIVCGIGVALIVNKLDSIIFGDHDD